MDQVQDLRAEATEAFNTMISSEWGSEEHTRARMEWLEKDKKARELDKMK